MRKILKLVAALGLFLFATGCGNNEKNGGVKKECEAVDLGLTSGTKWASCNVGADSPEKYGDYFAWGETQAKDVYSDTTYTFYVIADSAVIDSSAKKMWKSIGSDIAGTQYDAATVIMGDAWKMPTATQCKELLSECDWEWTMLENNIGGYKVTGKNGNSIFIPAAGLRAANDIVNTDKIGGFWTSTMCDDEDTEGDFAMAVYFYSESHTVEKGGRGYGRTIRAVAK